MIELIDKLIDDAVAQGRNFWDSYYGCTNKLHIEWVKEESDNYKALIAVLKEKGLV